VHEVVPAGSSRPRGRRKVEALSLGARGRRRREGAHREGDGLTPDEALPLTVGRSRSGARPRRRARGCRRSREAAPSWSDRREKEGENRMKGRSTACVPVVRKVFFAWRPDELPGAKVKCYFCGPPSRTTPRSVRRSPPDPGRAATTPAAASSAAPPLPLPRRRLRPPAGEPAAN
jgi:hypothetical protein